MKIQLKLTLEGDEFLDEKVKRALEEHPGLHVDLIKAFGHAFMMAVRLTEKDNLKAIGFTIAGLEEEEAKKVAT